MINLEEIIQQQGLSEKEAKIYLVLLGLHEALPSSIARKSGIKRPTTYVILDQLEKLGLASHVKKGAHLYFRPLDPTSFIKEQLHKYKVLEKALPELLNLHKAYGVRPQMSVFEGKEGLTQIMEDTLTARDKMLLCWADISLAVYTILQDYYPTYIEKKVKNKIYLKGIFPYEQKSLTFKKRGKSELREVYLVPRDRFPFKNEINIYDDKVAIISHQDEVGVIIQNQNIADTQRAIFNLGFEYAKLLEPKILTKEDKKYLAEPDREER